MKTVETRSQSAKKRSLGGKRCVRFSVSVTNDSDRKLSKLAVSCGMTKSELADQLIIFALHSPNVIDHLQNKYNKVEEYKVHPVVINNDLYY
ncbi:MAG: hypothetical protein ACQEUT_18335 [Bacillota bacterium]